MARLPAGRIEHTKHLLIHLGMIDQMSGDYLRNLITASEPLEYQRSTPGTAMRRSIVPSVTKPKPGYKDCGKRCIALCCRYERRQRCPTNSRIPIVETDL